ncbi:unannotated protein [freshwater metagenome]|jgi:hypothetical protein|uniref:Unannotated protein n=1 Tax=freshwater metagenome TaxID=449393 RepID=A0A6J6MCV5_9ZZZZ
MQKFLVILVALSAATALIIRIITKLPSKYERKPRQLSTWNALDHGIDPTDGEVL